MYSIRVCILSLVKLGWFRPATDNLSADQSRTRCIARISLDDAAWLVWGLGARGQFLVGVGLLLWPTTRSFLFALFSAIRDSPVAASNPHSNA
jgi:hypothetical protein